jgi:hypothetical protein
VLTVVAFLTETERHVTDFVELVMTILLVKTLVVFQMETTQLVQTIVVFLTEITQLVQTLVVFLTEMALLVLAVQMQMHVTTILLQL